MATRQQVVTRFAPSPSGLLHVGHLLAALRARQFADLHGGRCVLRIEDIDPRCRDPRWVEAMHEDFAWLGLRFDGEVMVQTRRFDAYAAALERLRAMGLLYPCFCTRGEIRAQVAELGRAPHATLGYLYPGTCRNLPPDVVEERLAAGHPHAWRLDMRRVQEMIGCPLWHDLRRGTQRCVPNLFGDVVLGLPVPLYLHHELLRDNEGKRLAKRDGARSLASLREEGVSPAQLMESLQRALERGGVWTV